MPRVVRAVHTESPSEELWYRLLSAGTIEGAKALLRDRIAQDFFGLDYGELSRAKSSHRIEFDAFRIMGSSDVEEHAAEISYCIRQAQEFYAAAKASTELTRPILYYYGMVSLAQVLIRSTYVFQSVKRAHGVQVDFAQQAVKIQKRGIFPRFHDCYEVDPRIYVTETKLSLQELFSTIPEVSDEYREVYQQEPLVIAPDPEIVMDTHHQVSIREMNLRIPALTSHFLAMFYLGSLARYRPKDWGEITRGDSSREIYVIRKFLYASARRFPNVLLNELTGKSYLFYTPARLG